MGQGEQPTILKRLAQVEEILIARVNPVLQVTNAFGGQYKYIGHSINFVQDIKDVASVLPQGIHELDALIVQRSNIQGQHYKLYVRRSHDRNDLQYKIKNDPYYSDVKIDFEYLSKTLKVRTNILGILSSI